MSVELEEYRKNKELMDKMKALPGRKLNMTLTEYIDYKNPKTVAEVQQIIDEWFIPEFQDNVEIVVCQKEGPVYIGLKILRKWPNGKVEYSPPGKRVISVPRDILLKNKRTLLIRRKKHDGIRSVQGTDSE